MTIVETRAVTGGVDTHLDVHVAAALDGIGGLLGVESFPTTRPATPPSPTGSAASAPSGVSESRGPAATAPAWLDTSPLSESRCSRLTGPIVRPAARSG